MGTSPSRTFVVVTPRVCLDPWSVLTYAEAKGYLLAGPDHVVMVRSPLTAYRLLRDLGATRAWARNRIVYATSGVLQPA